jgi:uncharacterized membrane protein required for colicin V production
MPPAPVAFLAADAVALILLVAFTLWGAWRGTLRLLLTLVILWCAFPLAARFGPRIEHAVIEAVSATGADLRGVAWLVVFAGVVLAGGVVLGLLQPLLGRVRPGGRWPAALLGFVHGAVVLTVIGYALLVGLDTDARPSWIRDLERSTAARGIRVVGSAVQGVVPLPHWLREDVKAVDARLEVRPVVAEAPATRR